MLELRGLLLDACERYLQAGQRSDAVRVLLELARSAAREPTERNRHFRQALELADDPELRRQIAENFLTFRMEHPTLEKDRSLNHRLLAESGRHRQLGASLEQEGEIDRAMKVYVQAGLLDEIDRLAAFQGHLRDKTRRANELLDELERARLYRDRLTELGVLKKLVEEVPGLPSAAEARRDLESLESRLLGPRILLDSTALRKPLHILVSRSLTLGRDWECDLRLAGTGVSRRHAKIYAHEARLYVEDLRSVNGTFLDGLRIDGYIELRGETRLLLGQSATVHLVPLPTQEGQTPSILLQDRGSSQEFLFLAGPLTLGAPGSILLRHPAFEDSSGALQLLPKEGRLLLEPAPGGPTVGTAEKTLDRPIAPFEGERFFIRDVEFSFRQW